MVPEGDDEGRYSDAFRASLLEARLDAINGRTVPLAQAKKRLGL